MPRASNAFCISWAELPGIAFHNSHRMQIDFQPLVKILREGSRVALAVIVGAEQREHTTLPIDPEFSRLENPARPPTIRRKVQIRNHANAWSLGLRYSVAQAQGHAQTHCGNYRYRRSD